ncbi:hypothetical protein AWB67_02793 [Caballeronia terrestris]|jgi:hypothetical protein|uniref:Uncharacterized protein n=1 Tax=Caballeronia terrestris TaxID=1226301 RepID=A0A158IR56_9BURK|nr:hypothetical protein [Caballeronia terrestris]SAL58996.1 hypothetical protein AWB67_02793 [Caballeronia terrestris]
MREYFIRDGNFTPVVRGVLCVVGIAIGFIGLKYDDSLVVALVGLVIAAIGGFASRAHMLKIKPFDNSYKKARKSYEVKDDEQDKSR